MLSHCSARYYYLTEGYSTDEARERAGAMKRRWRFEISILMVACLCMTPLSGYAIGTDSTQTPDAGSGTAVVQEQGAAEQAEDQTEVQDQEQTKKAAGAGQGTTAGKSGAGEENASPDAAYDTGYDGKRESAQDVVTHGASRSAAGPRVDGKQVKSTKSAVVVAEHINKHWEEGDYQEDGSAYQLERIIVRTDGVIQDSMGAEDAIHNSAAGEYVLEYGSASETRKAYKALAAEYGGENVMVDRLVSIQGVSAAVQAKAMEAYVDWGTHLMGLDSLKTESMEDHKVVRPKSQTVAILDTGINAKHAMFRDRIIRADSKSFIPSASALNDDHGHGSHVAGIVADATCKHVDFLILKVMDKNGQGGLYNVIKAIDYAVDHGASVINLSAGVDGIKPGSSSYQMMEESLERARNAGAVVVTAAGNGGKNLDKVYSYPAYSANTIAVGAIDKRLHRASFSYYGKDLDFVAPGKSVRSAWKGSASSYKIASGTSMAAPEISAAASMIKVEHPSYGHDRIYEVLLEDSVDLGVKGKDKYYGNGYVSMDSVDSTAVHASLLGVSVVYAAAKESRVPQVKLRLITRSKGKLRVSWSKGVGVQGYQIRYSRSKKMTDPKYKTIKKPSKTKYTLKGLDRKTTWYLQVRSYKTNGGEVYVSKWSGKKKARTK